MGKYANFYNSRSGDRLYNADSMTEWLLPFFTSGVFNGHFPITANNDMSITVGGGYVNIGGKTKFFEWDQTFTLEKASGTLPRIDNVILRRDDTLRDFYIYIETGGFSKNPTAPEITRAGAIHDLKLGEILVDVGVIKITQDKITDTRMDSAVCGIVTSTVKEIDTTTLFNQYRAWYENTTNAAEINLVDWIDNFKLEKEEKADKSVKDVLDAIEDLAENNGVWDSSIEYKRYSLVTFTINNDTRGYLAINPVPAGILPTDTRYWTPVTVKGDKGADAAVTELQNQYCFRVVDGHLKCYFVKGMDLPPFEIKEDGHLYYIIRR